MAKVKHINATVNQGINATLSGTVNNIIVSKNGVLRIKSDKKCKKRK